MPYAAADDAETADAQIGRPCAMWRVGSMRHVGMPSCYLMPSERGMPFMPRRCPMPSCYLMPFKRLSIGADAV